jgi:hypothetical protein
LKFLSALHIFTTKEGKEVEVDKEEAKGKEEDQRKEGKEEDKKKGKEENNRKEGKGEEARETQVPTKKRSAEEVLTLERACLV